MYSEPRSPGGWVAWHSAHWFLFSQVPLYHWLLASEMHLRNIASVWRQKQKKLGKEMMASGIRGEINHTVFDVMLSKVIG